MTATERRFQEKIRENSYTCGYNSQYRTIDQHNRDTDAYRATSHDRFSSNNSYNSYDFSKRNSDTFYHNNGFRKNYY
jgi:hypothetical protein